MEKKYTVVPAEIKIGVGSNYIDDPEEAIEDAYNNALAKIGENRQPSLLLVYMTANVDHEKALTKLLDMTKGEIPYSGCTTCQGAMEGNTWKNTEEMKLTSIWMLYDPEGSYEIGMADMSEAADGTSTQNRSIVEKAIKNAYSRH